WVPFCQSWQVLMKQEFALMKNWLALNLIKFLSLLPLSISRALGTIVGSLLWWTNGRSKRITLRNLQLCFPQMSEQDLQALARQSLIETSKTAAEAGAEIGRASCRERM